MTVKKMMVDRLIEMNTQELQVEPEENEIIDFYQEDLPLKVNLTILSLNQNQFLAFKVSAWRVTITISVFRSSNFLINKFFQLIFPPTNPSYFTNPYCYYYYYYYYYYCYMPISWRHFEIPFQFHYFGTPHKHLLQTWRQKKTLKLWVKGCSYFSFLLKGGIEKFGILTTSSTFPPLCTAEGKGCRSAKVGHHTEFLVIAKDRFGRRVTTGLCRIFLIGLW